MRIRLKFSFLASSAVICFASAQLARADSFSLDGIRYDCTITGLSDGKLSATIRGVRHAYNLQEVQSISIDDLPLFAQAEEARGKDPKKSAALYKQLIPAINNPALKLLAQVRAIDPTDRDGRWLEAVTLFLDVYQASPAESIFNARPSHFPAAGSSMLSDSADRLAAAIKSAKSDDAKKNLRSFLLDIYTKAGDTQAAQRLAREMSTGLADDAPPSVALPSPAPSDDAALAPIESDLRAKNFASVISRADALLAHTTGETAVRLFALKAQALEGQQQWESAAATWLRIPAHYASSPEVPAALLRAGQIDKQLNHPAAAQALFREILEKYPDSKEALAAKAQ